MIRSVWVKIRVFCCGFGMKIGHSAVVGLMAHRGQGEIAALDLASSIFGLATAIFFIADDHYAGPIAEIDMLDDLVYSGFRDHAVTKGRNTPKLTNLA